MKIFFRILYVLLGITIILPTNMSRTFAEGSKKTITILFTHDMHDHLLPSNTEKNGQVLSLGGYARLQSAINEERKKSPNLLLVDGGDFSMGTLFQSIYASDAPELRIMGQMGYDVITFGNHEYDFRATGLADTLKAAKESGDKLPQVVQSNVLFPRDNKGNLTESLSNLKDAMDNFPVKEYTVIERDGIRIGVFGLMGKDSADCAPMSEVKFTDMIEKAKAVVSTLKEKEKVELILCLSHSGICEEKSKSEDEILAKKVPEIDVIISGHTHSKLNEPIIVGKTTIVSAGEYSENLGVMSISQNSNKVWKVGSYKLKQIDNTLKEDPSITRTIDDFKKKVQEKYLDNFNLPFDEVLARSSFNFVPSSDIGKAHGEDTLGNLMSDAYIYAVKKAEGTNYDPVSVAIVPSGTIRGSFVKGDITVSDAFTASSLGIGADGVAGYPLISVYLTGKELKTACEVDASVSPLMSGAQLYMSGISFTFNPKRLIFNKVTDVKLQKADGSLEKIDDKKLYRVVAGLYSAQMLSVVGDKSFGLLSIVPKTKEGTPITDFEAQIITDSTSGKKYEVKEWLAIAEYLKSFDKVDDISEIPQYYNKTQDRKIVSNSKNIIELIKKPNSIASAIYGIIVAIILLVIFLIRKIVKRRKRKYIGSKRQKQLNLK